MGVVELTVWPTNSYGWTSRLGYGDYVFNFFSTVSYRLEGPGNWGKRFPRLLLDLCDHGVVEYEQLDEFEAELATIRKELQQFSVFDAVYDIAELEKPIPWEMLPGAETHDLEQPWVAPVSGRSFFDIFAHSMENARLRKANMLLIYDPETFNKDTLQQRKNKGREYWLGMLPINYGD